MSKDQKTLNTLLALRDRENTNFKKELEDITKTFRNRQGLYQGERRTHKAREGWVDDTTKMKDQPVQSTVKTRLLWMEKTISKFMQAAMDVEKTNASGTAKAMLVVDGVEWGEYSSLELLRLQGILGNHTFRGVYSLLPLRAGSERWKLTDDAEFKNEGIYENVLFSDVTRTTKKETIVVYDKQATENSNRQPVTTQVDNTYVTGDLTIQKFSGEISNAERAALEVKYAILVDAVTIALGAANNVQPQKSDLAEKVFKFLHAKL